MDAVKPERCGVGMANDIGNVYYKFSDPNFPHQKWDTFPLRHASPVLFTNIVLPVRWDPVITFITSAACLSGFWNFMFSFIT